MNKELAVFIISFFLYFLIGVIFSIKTQLVYHPNYICDLVLGFDNLMHQTSAFRHPLLTIFPLLGKWIDTHYGANIISLFIIFLTSFILSVQNVFVYRFNIEILKLSQSTALLALGWFVCFSANLLSIISFDSFVFTSLFMVMMFYYYVQGKEKRRAFYLVSFLQIGVTISQVFKILFLSLKQKYSNKLAFLMTLGLMLMMYVGYWVLKDHYNFLKIINYHSRITDGYKLLENFYSWMFGGVFVIPELISQKALYIDHNTYYAIQGTVGGFYRNGLVLILMLLFGFGVYKNWKQELIKIALSLLLIDIVIHVVFGYGNQELYLFSSHYQFLFYLIFALLIKNYQANRLVMGGCLGLMILMFSYNIDQIVKLFEFGIQYYPSK